MSKRVLFIPNDLGGGLGHVRRSLLVADILKKHGWSVGFLVHRKKTLQHIDTGYSVFAMNFPVEKLQVILRSKAFPIHYYPENKLHRNPYFWEFNSLNYQVLRDGYFTSSIVKHRFKKLAKVIDTWKPDLIVNDGHLLSYFLGRHFSIPVIQIIRYAVFPEGSNNLIWWKSNSQELIPPQSTKAFEELYSIIDEEPQEDARRFLKGDGYLIPGTSEIEPIQTTKPHYFFGYNVSSVWDGRLLKIDKKERRKKIYVTVGGGAHRSNVKEYYSFLFDYFKQKEIQIIFSDPFEILSNSFNKNHYPNISVFKWVDSSTIFPYLDLVIHHGGYGTFMESLWWGIPSIVIPFHTEQEGNGRRLEKINAGKVISFASNADVPVKFKCYFGEFTMIGAFERSLTTELFNNEFEKMTADLEYRQSASKYSQEIRANFDPAKILEFILNTR